MDALLKNEGCKAIMSLISSEIEELKEIEQMKYAVRLHNQQLFEISQLIAKREQAFFGNVYERLSLDKKLSYQANWRTGEVWLV